MNKKSYISLDFARRYDPALGVEKREVQKVDDKTSKPSDSLIRLIYSPDPVTKLPTGDLSYWVSDKVNPQIKEFILNNLMTDTTPSASRSLPDGISDDDAFELSRHFGESVNDYVDRLNTQINDTLWLNDQRRKSVSSESNGTTVANE